MIHSNEFQRCFFGGYPDVGAYRIRPLGRPHKGTNGSMEKYILERYGNSFPAGNAWRAYAIRPYRLPADTFFIPTCTRPTSPASVRP